MNGRTFATSDCLMYRTFRNAEAAREFRHVYGTGGWIFVPDPDPDPKRLQREHDLEVILFPPHVTPSAILKHPFTRGRSGRLLASA